MSALPLSRQQMGPLSPQQPPHTNLASRGPNKGHISARQPGPDGRVCPSATHFSPGTKLCAYYQVPSFTQKHWNLMTGTSPKGVDRLSFSQISPKSVPHDSAPQYWTEVILCSNTRLPRELGALLEVLPLAAIYRTGQICNQASLL